MKTVPGNVPVGPSNRSWPPRVAVEANTLIDEARPSRRCVVSTHARGSGMSSMRQIGAVTREKDSGVSMRSLIIEYPQPHA